MKLGAQKDFPLIPAGEHVLKLAACTVEEFDDKYGKSTTGKVERLKWKFVSNETDAEGAPYDYVVYTGMDYGGPRAGLTALLDMMVPGITKEDFDDFDTDDLVGKRFNALIKHVAKEDKSGSKAVHVYMSPIKAKSATPPPSKPKSAPAAASDDDDDDELTDPFDSQ